MTKTCGTCGHTALDDKAQFCNRCGAAVPEEKKPGFPVCSGCGTVVSDELAQFCNRCGARIPKAPVHCSSCGTPAIDNQSRFCTRCGTTFEQKPVFRNTNCLSCGAPDPHGESVFCNRCGAPFNRQGVQAAHQTGHAPVIVTQKKPAGIVPALTVPDTDWEPWTDVPPAPGFSPPSEPSGPEQSAHRDQQVAIPEKRYAHLPLIADEMKKKGGPKERPQKTGSQKKGVLGLLKK